MEGDSEVTRPRRNELSWDYRAFVKYAVEVLAIIKEREKADSVRKRALTPK
jgi:hypothetical protein